MDYRELASWLEELDSSVNLEEKIALIFLLTDVKPGVVLMSVSKGSNIYDFAEDFDLEVLQVEGEDRSLLNRLIGRDNRFQKDTVFLTKDDQRFEILEDEEPGFAGFTDESVGKFLGYPGSSLDYYGSVEVPGQDFREKIEELDFSDEELKYLNLVFYVPVPEEDYVDEAIHEGRRRAEKLEDLSDETYVDLFEEYRERALSD